MSDNVYALVYKFYRENDNARFILPQDLVEKYLRRLAWQGHGDQSMREVWGLIELLITERVIGGVIGQDTLRLE